MPGSTTAISGDAAQWRATRQLLLPQSPSSFTLAKLSQEGHFDVVALRQLLREAGGSLQQRVAALNVEDPLDLRSLSTTAPVSKPATPAPPGSAGAVAPPTPVNLLRHTLQLHVIMLQHCMSRTGDEEQDQRIASAVLLLLQYLTWACLEGVEQQGGSTLRDTGISSGSRTPQQHQSIPARPGNRQGGGLRGGQQHQHQQQGTPGGDRISPGASTTSDSLHGSFNSLSSWRYSESAGVPDSQCAEKLFNALVGEELYRFAALWSQGDADYARAIQFYTLSLTAAALRRFDNTSNGPFLTRLFPVESGSRGKAPSTSPKHLVLHPLLHSPHPEVRWAAALLLQHALGQLSCFHIAEEPHRQQRPLAFVPLSVQSGTLLLQLHKCLMWALLNQASSSAASSSAAMLSAPLTLQLFSILCSATPYTRCRSSAEEIQRLFSLPDFIRPLFSSEPSTAAAGISLLATVIRRVGLQLHVNQFLTAPVPSCCLPLHDGAETESPPTSSSLWAALISTLDDRPILWRSVTQVARFYPSLVQQHFDHLLTSSERLIQRCIEEPQQSAEHRKVVEERFGVAEMLRCWLHFVGFVWNPFDGKAEDPARTAVCEPRGTVSEKITVFQQLLCRLVTALLPSNNSAATAAPRDSWQREVVLGVLRGFANAGEECIEAIGSTPEGEKTLTRVLHFVQHLCEDQDAVVRSEALSTIGVWLLAYPLTESYSEQLVMTAQSRLMLDEDADCSTKAALALANASARLSQPKGLSADLIPALCEAAVFACCGSGACEGVQPHGIRMMSMLLGVLTVEDAIAPLDELPDEVVAEAFLRLLIDYLVHATEAKLRWNAAVALGVAISREVLFEAEPVYTSRAITVLCDVVQSDRVWKVRTRAAGALGGVLSGGLCGKYGHKDATPEVLSTLCAAFAATSEEGKRERNPKLMHPFEEYRRELRNAIEKVMRDAPHTPSVDTVLTNYFSVLQKERLM